MTGRPRERGNGQRHGFLDGPAVAALFRAARHHALPAREMRHECAVCHGKNDMGFVPLPLPRRDQPGA